MVEKVEHITAMSEAVPVIFYDGIVSRPQQASLTALDQQHVRIQTDRQQFDFAYADMLLIGALGNINPVVELPNEVRIEFLQRALPAWFNLKHRTLNHRLWYFERNPILIFASLLLTVGIIFGLIKFGMPFAAKQVADHLPATALNSVGEQAEAQIEQLTKPSKLPLARQQQIRQLYQQQVANSYQASSYQTKLLFREGDALGANAITLPNHTIIMTDELVKLAKDDRELVGVLAHEQGHIVKRHIMQQVLSTLGMSVFVTWMTGDASDLLSSVPYALLNLSYSRQFEREADLYAMQTLSQQQIPVHYFADFLKRLEKTEKMKEDGSMLDFLSSHPATTERIHAVEQFAAQQKIEPSHKPLSRR